MNTDDKPIGRVALVQIVLLSLLLVACSDGAAAPTQVTEATSLSVRATSGREEAEPTTSPEPTDTLVSPTDTPSVETSPTRSTGSDQATSAPDRPPNDRENIFVLELPTAFDTPRILFTSDDGDIRAMKPDGSEVVRLTFEGGAPWDRQPTWAPDRRRIAFISPGEPKPAIEGSSIAQLTFDGARNPAWSPDGNWIAFDLEGAIYKIRPDGTALTRVDGAQGAEPTWSPEGEELAFTRDGDLHVARVDGSRVERLSLNIDQSSCPPMAVYRPAWSPDGDTIAFDSHPSCVKGTGISVYTVDLATLLVSDPNGLAYQEPDWSPEGSHIIFESAPREISVMSFPEGEVAVDGYIQGYPGSEPTWSP